MALDGSERTSMAATPDGSTALAALTSMSAFSCLMMDSVRLFTRARTAAQIAEMSVRESVSWRIFFTF